MGAFKAGIHGFKSPWLKSKFARWLISKAKNIKKNMTMFNLNPLKAENHQLVTWLCPWSWPLSHYNPHDVNWNKQWAVYNQRFILRIFFGHFKHVLNHTHGALNAPAWSKVRTHTVSRNNSFATCDFTYYKNLNSMWCFCGRILFPKRNKNILMLLKIFSLSLKMKLTLTLNINDPHDDDKML